MKIFRSNFSLIGIGRNYILDCNVDLGIYGKCGRLGILLVIDLLLNWKKIF